MKHIITSAILLMMVACTTTSPVVDTKSNEACKIYQTISWALPLVEDIALSGKLSIDQEKLLTDAQIVLAAGCKATDSTAMARAEAAALALVKILYPFS